MNLQDLHAALVVRRVDDDLPVEPSGPQERRIENIRTIGGGQDHHSLGSGEAVHFREDLVERLLALVMPAEGMRASAGPPNRVDLVDEDD